MAILSFAMLEHGALSLQFFSCVFLCRTHVNSFESKMALEAEERSRELAEKVEQATYDQIHAQIMSDLELLRCKLPIKVSQAMETSQDMKYCRERQRTFVY